MPFTATTIHGAEEWKSRHPCTEKAGTRESVVIKRNSQNGFVTTHAH
jgi:hypothetical protein